MKRQQIIDIAAQIEDRINSSHNYEDMYINAKANIGKDYAYIEILPNQVPGKFCETIFNVEEILAFATVYKLSVHFTISSRFEAKNLPSIDLFCHDKIED